MPIAFSSALKRRPVTFPGPGGPIPVMLRELILPWFCRTHASAWVASSPIGPPVPGFTQVESLPAADPRASVAASTAPRTAEVLIAADQSWPSPCP